MEQRVVTESLAQAHLAGTSRRPDRLQLTEDEDLSSSSLLLALTLLIL